MYVYVCMYVCIIPILGKISTLAGALVSKSEGFYKTVKVACEQVPAEG